MGSTAMKAVAVLLLCAAIVAAYETDESVSPLQDVSLGEQALTHEAVAKGGENTAAEAATTAEDASADAKATAAKASEDANADKEAKEAKAAGDKAAGEKKA